MKKLQKVCCALGALVVGALATGIHNASAGTATSWPVSITQDAAGLSWASGSISDTRTTTNTQDHILCWYVANQNYLACRATQQVAPGANKRISCGTNAAWAATFAGINASSKVTFRCGPGGVLDFFEVANGSEFL